MGESKSVLVKNRKPIEVVQKKDYWDKIQIIASILSIILILITFFFTVNQFPEYDLFQVKVKSTDKECHILGDKNSPKLFCNNRYEVRFPIIGDNRTVSIDFDSDSGVFDLHEETTRDSSVCRIMASNIICNFENNTNKYYVIVFHSSEYYNEFAGVGVNSVKIDKSDHVMKIKVRNYDLKYRLKDFTVSYGRAGFDFDDVKNVVSKSDSSLEKALITNNTVFWNVDVSSNMDKTYELEFVYR